MNNEKLRSRILEAIPCALTVAGRNAIDAFLDLPHVNDWNPKDMYLGNLSKVFDVGLPFSFLKDNITAQAHRREIGRAVGTGKNPSSSLMSEVHAGAVLRNLGAAVSFVPRRNTPTPDIEALWDDGAIVDVEVVRGDTREWHRKVQNGVSNFIAALQAGDVEWHIVAFIADASIPQDLDAMFDAATRLQPEQCAGEPHRWFVSAVPLSMRDHVVGSQAMEYKPDWWPSSEPSFNSTSALIGAKGDPVVLLRSLIPAASYRNPVQRKAESGQARQGNPYVIALDVTQLPRAHDRIGADLKGYFEIWSHVSAVLLFEPRFFTGYGHKQWMISIHRNPFATIALPEHFHAVCEQPYPLSYTMTE